MIEEEQEKDDPRTQYELIRDFIEIRDDGFHCRMENVACSYVQQTLRTCNFIRHFRNEHTRASVENGMFRRFLKGRKSKKRLTRSDPEPILERILEADRAREFVEQDESGHFRCNINPASECPYQLERFRKQLFMRHFISRHPKKAREYGISFALFNRRQKRTADDSGSSSSNGRRRERCAEVVEESPDVGAAVMVDIDATVQNHVEFNGEKYLCRIGAGGGFCFYFQTQFNSHNFYRHFYTVHPQEAGMNGISREAYLSFVNGPQQVAVERPPTIFEVTSETETIFVKEERSAAEEEDTLAEPSYSESLEGEEEDDQQRIDFGQIARLIEGCTRKEGHLTYCDLDDGGTDCLYYQVNFRHSNFARHIRLRHTEQARRIGLFNKVAERKSSARLIEFKPGKRMKRLCDMVKDNVRFDGDNTYCQIDPQSECNFHQKHFNVSNFNRHFRLKHPNEAEEKGFLKRGVQKRLKKNPEESMKEKESRQLTDRVPDFVVRRTGGSGRAGYLCNIEPELGCPYYEPSLSIHAKKRFVRHFLRKHQDEARDNQFVHEDVGSNRKRVKRPQSVRSLVDRWVIKKGIGAQCNIAPGICKYAQKVYTPFNFARHFHTKHPRKFFEHGFTLQMIGMSSKLAKSEVTKPSPEDVVIKEELDIFEEPEESYPALSEDLEESMAVDEIPAVKQEYDPLNGNFDQATQESIEDEAEESMNDDSVGGGDLSEAQEEQDGNDQLHKKNKTLVEMVEENVREANDVTYCNIDGVPGCPYRQTHFNAHNFARHFRSMHFDEADRKGFYEFVSKKAPTRGSLGVIKKSPRMYNRQQSHRDMVLKHTKKEADGVHCRIGGPCPYVQKRLMVTNFERHFRAKHPKEAMEKGFNKVQKGDESGWRIKEKLHAQKFEQIWKECVEKDDNGRGHCRLVPGCTFVHQFSRPRFRLHFFQMHIDEAVRRGFTEEQELDKFSGTSDEQNELIKQCVERRDKGVYCHITEERCGFRRDSFEPNHFLRHFLLIHPEEASAKGVFKLGQPGKKSSVFGPFGNSTFQRMVFECTVSDEHGIHCRIDGTRDCTYSQSTLHLMDYLRHFRTVHTAHAKAKQFFRTPDEMLPRPGVFSTHIQKHVLQTDHEVRCAISSQPCTFTRDSFASRTFLRHFCLAHPDEAEANDFYNEVERPAGREPEPCRPDDSNEEPAEDGHIDEPYVAYENPLEEPGYIVADDHDVKQQLSAPNDDPSKYCRLCFSISPPLKLVFTVPGDPTLSEQIATCTGIILSAETESTASICCECLQKLADIQRFRQLCSTVDKAVRPNDTLPTIEKVATLSSSDIPTNGELPSPQISTVPGDDQSLESHSFQCRECEQCFDSTQLIMQHFREMHGGVQPLVLITKSYKCNDCDTKVTNRSDLTDHRQRDHNSDGTGG